MISYMKVKDNSAYLASLVLVYSSLPTNSYVFYSPSDANTVLYEDIGDEETQLITLNRVLSPKRYDIDSYVKKLKSKYKLDVTHLLHVYGTLDAITGNRSRTFSSVHIFRHYCTGDYIAAPLVSYSGSFKESAEMEPLAEYCLKLFRDKGPAFTVNKKMVEIALSNLPSEWVEKQKMITYMDMYPEVFK